VLLTPAEPSRGTAGFTLLEVVIALVIAMLALVGLFEAGRGGLFAADTASRVDEAVERAQSHLAAFAQSGVIASGLAAGDDGDGFRWELRARPLARTAAGAAAPNGSSAMAIYAIDSTIAWRSGLRARSVTLETRRLVPAPSQQ